MDKLSANGVDLPVAIENGNGRIVFDGDRITLESFTAQANDGTLTAGGSMTLAGLQPKEIGRASCREGVELPVAIENGKGSSVLAGDRITLESFTAQANDGTVHPG